MRSAQPMVTSMIRPLMNGPLSVMRTISDLPLAIFVTLTRLPNGRVLCAAVEALFDNRSPLAVRVPELVLTEYHDALPCCTVFTFQASVACERFLAVLFISAQAEKNNAIKTVIEQVVDRIVIADGHYNLVESYSSREKECFFHSFLARINERYVTLMLRL